jgi:hypothetical protein
MDRGSAPNGLGDSPDGGYFIGQDTPGNPPFALLDGVTFSGAPAVTRRRRSPALA